MKGRVGYVECNQSLSSDGSSRYEINSYRLGGKTNVVEEEEEVVVVVVVMVVVNIE